MPRGPKPHYTLQDRAIVFQDQGDCPDYSADRLPWACIFCGNPSEHVNEGGTHCWLGAVYDGQSERFAYCNEDGCRETGIERAYETGLIWRCGCVPDYVENIGVTCHACLRVRDDRILVQ